MPTVIVSGTAERQLHDVKRLRKQRNKPSGVYLLDPDYRKYMQPSGRKDFPSSESDLKPYQKWIACGRHWDVGNASKADNRYLLVGRPQIGKTGVFLHLAFRVWREAKKPRYTSPSFEGALIVKVEQAATSEDEEESSAEEPNTLNINMDAFPDFNVMKELKLEKCSVSSRYGDPNIEKVRDHYLKKPWKQFPFRDALRGGRNTLMKRAKNTIVKQSVVDGEKESDDERHSVTTTNIRVIQIRTTNPFCSKSIQGEMEIADMEHLTRITDETYEGIAIFDADGQDLGTLYLNKIKLASKWNLSQELLGAPTIKKEMKLPPVLIPSSGRAKTALLDLSDAMEGKESFVEIVVIRPEEKYDYFKTALLHPALDVFVMNISSYNTVGEARWVAKKLGEQITDGTEMKHLFILDDNILFWNGITLINDPCNLFGLEANHVTSQRTDISLLSVLNHFSRNNFEKVKDFNLIGFSIGALSRRSITRRRSAFGRKHVAAAVLINLLKSKKVDYNQRAWAMEDIDFNLRTDKLREENPDEGVIVKCLRFVACKKKVGEGGVVPCDVPEDVWQLMQACEEWAGVEERKSETHLEEEGSWGEKCKDKGRRNGILDPVEPQPSASTDEEGSEEAKRGEIERLMTAKASVEEEEAELQRAIDRMKKQLSEKRKIKETLNADIATLQGAELNESYQESESKKKRRKTQERPEIDVDQIADAELSKILPAGLEKEKGTSIKVRCKDKNKEECEECRYIPKPFHHFAVYRGKAHGDDGYCHMCSLYEADDTLSSLAEEYLKIKKLISKKRRSR